MSDLYSIQLEYLRIMEVIEENDGEIDEHIEKELELLLDAKEDFINSVCKNYTNLELDVVTISREIERLQERKQDTLKRIDTVKKMLTKVLKFFDMRSTNKKSKGYAFNTGLFSGYTRSVESVEVDNEAILAQFTPITGKKSDYVDYTVSVKVSHANLLRLNELGIIPVTAYSPTVNKTSVKEYLKSVAQSQELSSENADKTVEHKSDPIADYANIVSKESLVIK